MDIKKPLKQPNLLSFIDDTLQFLFVIRTISLTVGGPMETILEGNKASKTFLLAKSLSRFADLQIQGLFFPF